MKINIPKIEKERERQRMTAGELAEKIGLTKQAYSYFIKFGSTRLSTLTKIAEVLGFEGKDLLSEGEKE